MQDHSIGEASRLLGVSIDTLRRWDRHGRIRTRRDQANRRLVPDSEVERLRALRGEHGLSARNRLRGVVRELKVEGLLAQVELEAGPFRVVAVITREAAEALQLRPGEPATAIVKATSVLIER
ncbi:MAG TPA: helix-turn-helix transcriptional regulator [Gaiellaceae bacterium]|nr:helix-turn-helix transcriptional regulator [Gaiellaceae bacterium]